MADGGATYTVNIELATRQFSQDLRNLRTKIKNELGKAVKVTSTPDQKAEAKEKARRLREKRVEDREARKRFYNADKINAFRVRQGKATADNNKLLKIGLDVEKRQKDIGAAMEAAEKGRFQWAEAKLKVAKEQIKQDFKDLDLINKQAAAEKKVLTDKENAARKLENRARKGPYGQRMYGPIDKYGTQVYTGYKNPRTPPVPKSGASLPIDLGRKGTGTFATKQTELLRRRQTLETLLETFKGVNTDEVRKFKTGIQTLITEYSKVSDLQTKMRPTGMGGKAMGGWGAWKGDKLITKDKIGSAGTLSRQLEQLDNLTKREEARGKQIRLRIKAEEEFLNKKHRIEKLLATFDKKGVATDAKRLKLEKAITVQDKQQLDTLLRELELENIGLRGVSGTGGGRGGRGGRRSSFVGGPSSPLNFAANGQLLPGRKPPAWGRIGQSAMISGGFPLLFGQNPLVAGLGAAGGAIGESLTPGGGFAGGIAATAISTVLGTALTSVKNLSEALNPLKFNADKAVEALGFLNSERAREIKLIEKTRGSNAALLEVRKDLQERYGPSGVEALDKFDKGWDKFMKGFKSSLTDVKVNFAEFIDSITSDTKQMRDLGLSSLGDDHLLVKQYNDLTKQIKLASDVSGPNAINNMLAGNARPGMFNQSIVLTRQGEENVANLKAKRDKLTPGLVAGGIDADASKLISDYNAKFTEQVRLQEYNLDVQKRILDLRAKGINPAIAKTIVKFEEMNDINIELLKHELAMKEAKINEGNLKGQDLVIAQQSVVMLEQKIVKQKELNQAKIDEIEKSMQANIQAEKQLALWKDIGSTIKSGLVEGINAAIDGTKSLGEIAGNVFRKISNALLDYGISALLANSGLPGAKKFFGFANGGRPPKGRPSIVGERGPELFVPDSAGTIIPNHEMGGANVVVNVDASGSSVEGDAGAAQELGSMLAAAIQAELVKEKRPGGLLA